MSSIGFLASCLARVIAAAIETMVRVIRGFQLGPTASLAKLAEQSLAVIQFVVAGGVFGFLVALLGARYPSRIEVICLAGAVIFLAGALLVEASLGIQQIGFLGILWIALVSRCSAGPGCSRGW